MKIFFLLAGCIFATGSFAQSGLKNDTGYINIHKDPRLDSLVEKHREINELTLNSMRKKQPGYRILVVNTNDRREANNIKAKFYREFPDIPAYLQFQTPFYKLKVGNYLNREDAEEQINSIKRVFGNSVYVVRDIIDVTPEKLLQDSF